MIEFRALGEVELRGAAAQPLHSLAAQPKRIALLSYLCVAAPRGFHRRDTLLALFWPDSDQEHARASLRHAIHVLRRSLGSDVVLARGDEELCVSSQSLWCDAVAFDEAVAAGRAQEAAELYRGDFLAGFFIRAAPEWERWLDAERTRLRSRASQMARAMAERSETERNITGAVHWAGRAVELTGDDDERAFRRLLELFDRIGERAGALRAYDAFARRLQAEYGTEPAAETLALLGRIRARHAAVIPSGLPSVSGYEIERELARGEIANVYLARDLKHDRPVVIKMLRRELTATLGISRFLSEIEIAARLRHPHILPLYDSGTVSGVPFYVMPLASGYSLRDRLRRHGTIPITDSLRILRDIAGALALAHRHGIVHCDVKPENILLEEEHAVLADFGIARAVAAASISEGAPATGIPLGSPGYMAPEQSSAAPVFDARADVYALGVVAYEMLAGITPFAADSDETTVSAKRTGIPRPLNELRSDVEQWLADLVAKALAPEPDARFQDSGQLATALERGAEAEASRSIRGVSDTPPAPRPSGRKRVASVMLGIVVILFGAALVLNASRRPPPSGKPSAQKVTFTGAAIFAALSLDGKSVAYLAQARDSMRVLVQEVAGGRVDTIAAFGQFGGAHTMEWSPDGTQLLIASEGRIRLFSSHGGHVRNLFLPSEGGPFFAYWLPDGTNVSIHGEKANRVLIVNLQTQDTVAMPVHLPLRWLNEGSWSPDGRLFAVLAQSSNKLGSMILALPRSGTMQVVVEDTADINSPRWGPDGRSLYYVRGINSIMRVRVSERTGARIGAPEEVMSGLQAVPAEVGVVRFSLSRDGTKMAYAKGERFSNIFRVVPEGAGKPPRMFQITNGTALRSSPTVSPDGHSIALVQEVTGIGELFRMPISGGSPVQVTSGARVWSRSLIAWSPDGARIAFESVRGAKGEVWTANIEDGELRRYERTNMNYFTSHLAWAPGARIAYQHPGDAIALLNPVTGDEQLLSRDTVGVFHFPKYSPDGERIVAVRHRPPGPPGVSVFRVRDGMETKIPGGLLFPRGWSPDGNYFYAQDPAAPRMLRVASSGKGGPRLVFAAPVREVDCTPAGPLYPREFICAVLDFVSDVWLIENFDSR